MYIYTLVHLELYRINSVSVLLHQTLYDVSGFFIRLSSLRNFDPAIYRGTCICIYRKSHNDRDNIKLVLYTPREIYICAVYSIYKAYKRQTSSPSVLVYILMCVHYRVAFSKIDFFPFYLFNLCIVAPSVAPIN